MHCNPMQCNAMQTGFGIVMHAGKLTQLLSGYLATLALTLGLWFPSFRILLVQTEPPAALSFEHFVLQLPDKFILLYVLRVTPRQNRSE